MKSQIHQASMPRCRPAQVHAGERLLVHESVRGAEKDIIDAEK
jgi:hypothetical protein